MHKVVIQFLKLRMRLVLMLLHCVIAALSFYALLVIRYIRHFFSTSVVQKYCLNNLMTLK